MGALRAKAGVEFIDENGGARGALWTMEGYGLVRLERGERGRITPKVMHDRVELDLLLTISRKAS